MRIAWLGPAPRDDHGVPYVATQLLLGLARRGVEVDCFCVARGDEIPDPLLRTRRLTWVLRATGWGWDRWYSRTAGSAYLTRQAVRTIGQRLLTDAIARRHAVRPYDVLYQFSAIESVGRRGARRMLPPLVLHPQVHAAGELAWHRREEALSSEIEPRGRRAAARALLIARARAQRRDAPRARMVVVPSARFGRDLSVDYGVAPERLRVVPNPIDLERFRPSDERRSTARFTVLFVAQLSVRKGVQDVVELSHRLADIEGVVLEVVGDGRPWSDYSPLLEGLHPTVGRVLGRLEPDELAARYAAADLLVQPSRYEPFGLTVGEALASGTPVVVSRDVGAAEFLDRRCGELVPAGDVDALAAAVRDLIAELRTDPMPLRRAARDVAERRFRIEPVSERLEAALREAAAR